MTTTVPRLSGIFRQAVAEDLAELYMAGATIRDLADQTGRSYSGVRKLLVYAGVELRTTGRRGRKAAG